MSSRVGRPVKLDLSGQKFGRWLVESRADVNAKGEIYWNCTCECGTRQMVRANTLTSGRSTSCGCLHREAVTSHGYTGTPTFKSWESMRQRCNNPKSPDYPRYGGRGIRVCERWQNDFAAFLADMGERPDGLTLDRKDVDGDYEPSNCHWATRSRQQRNRTVTELLTHDGQTMCLKDWSEKVGISAKILSWRLKNGWDPQKALSTPAIEGRGKKKHSE